MALDKEAKQRGLDAEFHSAVRRMADVIQGPGQAREDAAAPVTMRQGVVVTVSPDPLTITLGGNPEPVPAARLAEAYIPSIGDVVMVLQFDGDLLILGRLAFV